MNLADPDDIGGNETGIFTFPFVTHRERDPARPAHPRRPQQQQLPVQLGTHAQHPDNNEFIVIRLDVPLPMDSHGRDERDDDDWRGDSRR